MEKEVFFYFGLSIENFFKNLPFSEKLTSNLFKILKIGTGTQHVDSLDLNV